MNNTRLHSIGIASQRSGLSQHVIRVWEKRYQALSPVRTETKRRQYTDDDILRLVLFSRLTKVGHKIGNIAGLSNNELEEMIKEDIQASLTITEINSENSNIDISGDLTELSENEYSTYIRKSLKFIQDYDQDGLEKLLSNAVVHVGRSVFCEKIAVPLMAEIGKLWSKGELRIVHEHIASLVVRSILESMREAYQASVDGPLVIGATMTGQFHEFGLLTALNTAASEGFKTLYFGVNLPYEEIVLGVQKTKAKFVILSMPNLSNDFKLLTEVKMLLRNISHEVQIIIGGPGSMTCKEHLEESSIIFLNDLSGLREILRNSMKKIQ